MQGYFENKEFERLLASYEEAKQRGENIFLDSEQLTDIAEYYHWMGRSEDAVAVADQALSMYEGATAPLVLKARIALLTNNDPKGALALAEQIEDKFDLDYYYIKAEILIAIDKAEEADIYLDYCLEQVDDNDYEDFLLDVATLFVDYEQTALARKWLERSEEHELNDYQEILGRILYFEKDYEGSINIFERLIDNSPYTTYYWDMLACNQLALGKTNEAINSSEFAIAINPNEESALLYKGQALMRLKNYEEAITYFERYGSLRPSNIDGMLNKGLCLTYLNRHDEGISYIEASAEAARKYCPERLWEVYQEMVFSYSQHHNQAKAMACIDQMDRLKDADTDETMVLRGHVYLENFDLTSAQECFRKAIEHSSYSPPIMMRVAVSLYDNNYVQTAYNILSGFQPKDFEELPQAYAYLAICAHDLGKEEEYLDCLRKAIQMSPFSARAVLSPLFPEDLEPADYLDYAQKHHHQ